MKAKFFLITIFVFVLTGCVTEPTPYVPLNSMVIVKMNEHLQNEFIVSPIALSVKSAEQNTNGARNVIIYGDSLALTNAYAFRQECLDFVQNDLFLLDYTPYILLGNGYALVTWRWRYFISFAAPYVYINLKNREWSLQSNNYNYMFSYMRINNNGRVENEEFYTIPVCYKDLKDLKQQWPLADGQPISRPEVLYITPEQIDKYREQTYKPVYGDGLDMMQCFSAHLKSATAGMAYAHMLDSIENIYVATLNKMITNNDLEQWTTKQ